MCDIPFDRSFLQLSNGIKHVMPSTDTKPELTAKPSMTQPVSQPAVYANGLIIEKFNHYYYHPGRSITKSHYDLPHCTTIFLSFESGIVHAYQPVLLTPAINNS
jgi:hypothetical protein